MSAIWEVFKKEVIDNLRDQRSLSSSLLTPLITPMLLIGLIIVLGSTLNQDPAEKSMELPLGGAEYAPSLVQHLKANNIIPVPLPADPRAAVREGEIDVAVIIAEDFSEAMRDGRPAPVQIISDSSRQSALSSIRRVESAIQQYSTVIGYLRLQARGVDPQILSAVGVEQVDVSTPESQTLLFLNMMPFLIIMTVFLGSMYVIIDATAGERERGSLEPLLINPVRRGEMVIGKLLASLPFGVAVLALTLAAIYAGFNLIPIEEMTGFPMVISTSTLMFIFWLSLPMVVAAAALQMVVAAFTKSFKEAQTYLSLLPLAAGIPGMFLAFVPVRPAWSNMLIPTYGQSILINQALRGEVINPAHIWVTTLATLAVAVGLCALSIWQYQREQILIGR